ncbi:MAG: hypothetical protein EOQ55_09365 [Mesorhizobium sp.]|uniref:hypothetical protein n=1 Tax=Mesorhizobium sp. TaxID=1871066 RepID=UPI000FEA7C28|nr:hypothetical protein [Mesorhizobium sp.]RWG20940.1 MAG: hypothetical protein EOQ55_09365 [Mesorhizobium sp.]
MMTKINPRKGPPTWFRRSDRLGGRIAARLRRDDPTRAPSIMHSAATSLLATAVIMTFLKRPRRTHNRNESVELVGFKELVGRRFQAK